jgi:hypothetical protein
MREPLDDPELIYEIGSESLIAKWHDETSYKKMVSAPKRKEFGWKYRCKKCKVTFINK